MSKPICDSIRINIPDSLRGMLAPDEEETLRQHLAVCPSCAAEAQRLQPLMQELLPHAGTKDGEPDWGSLSVRLNAEIDRRQKRRLPRLVSASVLLPAAAVVVILFTLWLLPRFTAENAPNATPAYAVTLDRSDVEDIAKDGLRTLSLENISVTTGEQPAFGLHESTDATVIIADSAVTSELHTALAESIGFGEIVSTTMEYFSTDAVLDAISDDDAALLASALEIEELDFQ